MGVYLVSVAWASWPVQLLQARWVVRFAESLHGGASFPLVGAALMLIGQHLNGGGNRLVSRLTREIRALAIFASIGFLLLIPLQGYGLWGLAQAEDQQDRISIDRLTGATRAIAAATGDVELREAISGLPGAASLSDAPLKEPAAAVRQRLLNELTPQLRQLQLQLEARRKARLRRILQTGSRDALVCLLYALPFAAIGRWRDRRYSFLSDLLDLFDQLMDQLRGLVADLPHHLRLRR